MADRLPTTNVSPGPLDSTVLSMAAVQAPTRIKSLDVLRGVGVLGMPAVCPDGCAVTHATAIATATSAGANRLNLRDIVLLSLIAKKSAGPSS